MKVDQISIVLVEPQGALNIGSICRAMMNFGFSDLRLVNPEVDHLGGQARLMAVKAEPLLTGAKVYDSLEAALFDCNLALGTTRRFGKYRDDFLQPDAAAERTMSLPDGSRAALVFGREDRGLHTDELDLCQLFITLPTDEKYPSMNLAQAATLCMYEVRKIVAKGAVSGLESKKSAPTPEIEQMFQHMRSTLLEIEYLDPLNPDHILRTFRRIFGRAGLEEREVRILQGLWSRIDWVEGERRKHSPASDE